jgi:uncharacterized DUF497 family protein
MNGDPVFEWDSVKSESNLKKHTISFEAAQHAFKDPKRIIAIDNKHSTPNEKRFFCYGMVDGSVITVRFTWRNRKIRIFGAGYWRDGRSLYYAKNQIY